MEYLYYQQKIVIKKMKIDKNSLTYANEHPKGKKPTEENIKVAKSSASTLENYSKDIVNEYKENVKEGYKGSIRKYILEFYGPEYLR